MTNITSLISDWSERHFRERQPDDEVLRKMIGGLSDGLVEAVTKHIEESYGKEPLSLISGPLKDWNHMGLLVFSSTLEDYLGPGLGSKFVTANLLAGEYAAEGLITVEQAKRYSELLVENVTPKKLKKDARELTELWTRSGPDTLQY